MGDGGGLGKAMRDSEFLSKTDAGRAEMQTRANKLPSALRSILLLVDGRRDVALLRRLSDGLHGPADALEQLMALQLIAAAETPEPAPANAVSDVAMRYSMLSGLMSEAVRQHLGLRGFFMQLKIERCADFAELELLLPDVAEAVAKARTREYALHWEKGVRAAVAQ
ncbi:MAG: hypothetical protein ABIW82_10520 [Dokdonella sp.]